MPRDNSLRVPPFARTALAAALIATGAMLPAPVLAEGVFSNLLVTLGLKSADEGIASSNGRLEAQSVDVASKYAGRIATVTVHEGDVVTAGQIIATIDDRDVQAKLAAAEAAVLQAKASKEQAGAAVQQAESALSYAETTFQRTTALQAGGIAAKQALDDATNGLKAAQAGLASATAQVSAADALIASAQANVQAIQVALDDLTIRAPLAGRVEYRLHEPGEVIAAGTPVVTLLDLTDVYMNLYLPADTVATLSSDDDARLIFDAIPQYVIPARVTFISPEAQFTPKSVETAEERAKLVFRVKLSIPKELLEKFQQYVKVGVRGMGYVRNDPAARWPANLTVKLPQ